MTQKELIKIIRQETGFKENTIACIMKAYVKITSRELASGNNVKVHALGVLYYVPASSRNGYNPVRGQQEVFKISNKVKFVPSRLLLKAVNTGKKE